MSRGSGDLTLKISLNSSFLPYWFHLLDFIRSTVLEPLLMQMYYKSTPLRMLYGHWPKSISPCEGGPLQHVHHCMAAWWRSIHSLLWPAIFCYKRKNSRTMVEKDDRGNWHWQQIISLNFLQSHGMERFLARMHIFTFFQKWNMNEINVKLSLHSTVWTEKNWKVEAKNSSLCLDQRFFFALVAGFRLWNEFLMKKFACK